MKSSLKISFMPSARVCSNPNGPALFGPTRFCMPAMILRSNQTMNIVLTRPTTKITRTFTRTITIGVHSRPLSSSGSMANSALIGAPSRSLARRLARSRQPLHPHVERRRGGVDDVGDRGARHVERHLQRPARHALVAGDRQHDGALGRHDADLVAVVHADAI